MKMEIKLPDCRSFRNNNPGNIRHGRSHWNGMSEKQTDKSFVQFTDMYYGVRALTRLFHTYRVNYHCGSIRQIINRFAPVDDKNPTERYIAHCAKVVGVHPDTILADPFNGSGRRDYARLVAAISSFESGCPWYDDYFYTLAMLNYCNGDY